MKLAALVVLLILALPPAVAQIPSSVCGPLNIPSPSAPPAVSNGGEASVDVTVENNGRIDALVTVTASTSTAGWTITASPDPATVTAGQSKVFTFTLTAGSAANLAATVAFAANGACNPPAPLPACTQSQCTANANGQVVVPYKAPSGFQFPDLSKIGLNVGPEYIIAAIVLIGLATAIPFAMRRKKTGVVAACPEPLKMVRAGRGTSFPIEIRNGSKDAATAQFEVGPVPEGWSAFMPLPEVQLASREARSLWLMVRSPQGAAVGDAVDVELRLRDPKHAKNGSVVKVRAEVQAGTDAAPAA